MDEDENLKIKKGRDGHDFRRFGYWIDHHKNSGHGKQQTAFYGPFVYRL
jgi:hypothetical protein